MLLVSIALIFVFACCLPQVNQKGSEKPLEEAFAKMATSFGNNVLK